MQSFNPLQSLANAAITLVPNASTETQAMVGMMACVIAVGAVVATVAFIADKLSNQ